MSKSSELSKTVKRYILDRVDASGYDIAEPETDKEKVAFIHDNFYAEMGWRVNQAGEPRALVDWYQGLCSTVSIEFYNHDIIDRAIIWGSLPADHTERQADKILENWWKLLATKTNQMFQGNYS